GLVRSGVHLTNSYLRRLYWARPLTQQAADEATGQLHHYDEDRALLDSAIKGSDGFFTTFFVSPYSKYIARWSARRGLTPNAVTTISMALGVVAAVAFATGSRAGLIAGALLLQAAFTFDCVDGQLARYTRQFSKLGAWLDSVFDRGKEYLVFAGLAIGATAGFGDNVWALAAAALALQTVRHTVDFSYATARHQALAALPTVPLAQPEDRKVSAADAQATQESEEDEPVVAAQAKPVPAGSPLQRAGAMAIRLSRALERKSWMRWVKKIVVLPIGERFALISLTAAVWEPRVTFVALLIWGSFALIYQLTGKVMRSVAA
ncbi:MAG: CDP-alcohol phosphatidyltransferase family protein, partial [Thermocrispum sp.]